MYWISIVDDDAPALHSHNIKDRIIYSGPHTKEKYITSFRNICYTDPAWLSLTNERQFVD